LDKVLVDTSVWIEFFRKREPYFSVVTELIDADAVCCTGLIYAELLQGAKTGKELNTIREFRHVFEFLPESVEVWEKAGELSFRLQRKGKSVGLSDCLIAVSAEGSQAHLLTMDKHFSAIRKELGIKLFNLPE
jgi:predicted nucleic acid-binding protein